MTIWLNLSLFPESSASTVTRFPSESAIFIDEAFANNEARLAVEVLDRLSRLSWTV